jgi:hypothetical protein
MRKLIIAAAVGVLAVIAIVFGGPRSPFQN